MPRWPAASAASRSAGIDQEQRGSPARSGNSRTKCRLARSAARPAARCRAARRRSGGRAAGRVPVSIVMVSPTTACSTYCSDVASATTGTAPSANGRSQQQPGIRAFGVRVRPSTRRSVNRPLSMKPGSGATIVGFVGRYRFRQLASSPGRTRKRVKMRAAMLRRVRTPSASRPPGSLGLCTQRHLRLREQGVAAGAGLRIVVRLPAARAGTRRRTR